MTLAPGATGRKKLVERYGSRLVCIRYRYDSERRRRLKTVELIEEELPWTSPGAMYLVKIGIQELALCEQIKAAGARWTPDPKLWMATGEVVRRLSLHSRITGWLQPDD